VDPVKEGEKPARGVLFYVGSVGLLGIMTVESIAVIGRHVGMPVLGALELAQASIVPAACAAMLIATLAGAHAAVHMLTDRMPPAARDVTTRAGSLLAAGFFAALAAGAFWLAGEFWNSFEHSEVLHIPFRPLRALVALSALALAGLFLFRALRPKPRA
jgi:TRAP-type C4-dicarboxylate transport system permease small subunit